MSAVSLLWLGIRCGRAGFLTDRLIERPHCGPGGTSMVLITGGG